MMYDFSMSGHSPSIVLFSMALSETMGMKMMIP